MSNLGIWIGFSFAGLCVLGIVYAALAMKTPADLSPRSEERRVGKECVG